MLPGGETAGGEGDAFVIRVNTAIVGSYIQPGARVHPVLHAGDGIDINVHVIADITRAADCVRPGAVINFS